MHRAFHLARSYAPPNRTLDEDALVDMEKVFDSQPIGKGQLGARAILATYLADYEALVAKLHDSRIVSTLPRRKLTAFLSRVKASHSSKFRSKVLELAADVDDGKAEILLSRTARSALPLPSGGLTGWPRNWMTRVPRHQMPLTKRLVHAQAAAVARRLVQAGVALVVAVAGAAAVAEAPPPPPRSRTRVGLRTSSQDRPRSSARVRSRAPTLRAAPCLPLTSPRWPTDSY